MKFFEFNRSYDYFIFIFIFIFGIPLTFQSNPYRYASCYLISVYIGLIARFLGKGNILEKCKYINNLTALKNASYFFIIIFMFLGLFYFLGIKGGLIDRVGFWEDVYNQNPNGSDFVESQIIFLLIALAVYLFSFFVFFRKFSYLIMGCFISSLLLFYSGTRWHFLIAVSPFIYNLLLKIKKIVLLFIIGSVGFLLEFIAVFRSNSNPSFKSIFNADMPSFASFNYIEKYPYSTFANGFQSFINGNLLIAIPRFIFPNKPIDYKFHLYNFNEIGEAFNHGGSVLPGFLGSCWMYGGYVSIVIFSFLLFYSASKLSIMLVNEDNAARYGNLIILYVGLFLQFRGISIFYLMPAIYYSFFLWAGKHILFVRKLR